MTRLKLTRPPSRPPDWPFALNLDSPLCDGMQAAWVSASGGYVDLVGLGGLGALTGGSSRPGAPTDGFESEEFLFDGAGYWQPDNSAVLFPTASNGGYTIAYCAKLDVLDSSGFSNVANVAFDGDIAANINYNTAGAYSDIAFGRSGVTITRYSLPSGGSLYDRHWGVATWTGTTRQMWLNGESLSSPGSSAWGNISKVHMLGQLPGFSTYKWDGGVFAVIVVARTWGEAEARAWYDPATRWSWLRPSRRTVWFGAAVAPTGDVRPRFYHHRHHNRAA